MYYKVHYHFHVIYLCYPRIIPEAILRHTVNSFGLFPFPCDPSDIYDALLSI